MKHTRISVTKAASNFAHYVNLAHYEKQTFVRLKHGVPFARLESAGVPACRGSDLAAALAAVELSPADARAWQRNLKVGRKKLNPPAEL